MNSIDASALNGRPRPRARILQWGEGNFLRAFVDWKIDRMNEAGGLDWGVVIVRPIAEGNPRRSVDVIARELGRNQNITGRQRLTRSRIRLY